MKEIDTQTIYPEDRIFSREHFPDAEFQELILRRLIIKSVRANGGVATENRIRCDIADYFNQQNRHRNRTSVPKGFKAALEEVFYDGRLKQEVEVNGRVYSLDAELREAEKKEKDDPSRNHPTLNLFKKIWKESQFRPYYLKQVYVLDPRYLPRK